MKVGIVFIKREWRSHGSTVTTSDALFISQRPPGQHLATVKRGPNGPFCFKALCRFYWLMLAVDV